jgi:hypothetical protein
VDLFKSTGETLGTTKIGSNGSATISFTDYSGPIIAQVKGSTGCQYFDEALGSLVDFPTGKKLSAVVDTTRTEVGINVLTNLAAARLLDGNKLAASKTSDDIKTENLSIQRMFQVSDMFTAPTPIDGAGTKLTATTEADKLALKLAALAEIAKTRDTDVVALANALAADLATDGSLDTLDATALKAGLAQAITHITASSTQLAFTELADNTNLVTKIADVKADVSKILVAGTALDQAKKLFSDLRTNLLALSNDAGTGTLDKENELLKTDYKSSIDVNQALRNISLMAEATSEFFGGGTKDHIGNWWYGYCTKDTDTTAHCWFYGTTPPSDFKVDLVKGGTGISTWSISEAYNYETMAPFPTPDMTGSITASNSGASVNGKFVPITGDSANTVVSLSYTYDATTSKQKWNGSGFLDARKTDNTSALKAEIKEFAADENAQTAKTQLVLTGPHHVFDGTLELNGIVAASDSTLSQPKNGKLRGTFTNTVSSFKIFDGTLTASQDWSKYDPRLQETDDNYPKVTISFDGTVFKSPDAPGLTLNLSGNNNTGRKAQTVSLKFTSSSVIVTGTGTQSRTSSGNTWDWALANEIGLKLTYSNASKSGKVLKADGTELGTISTQRVTFVDGTFESLI